MVQDGDPVYIYQNQDFHAIRDWCLRSGILFEDPSFKLDNKYQYLRPYEIVNNPKLYVGGANRWDIIQGELGDCWMLASISALANHTELVERIVPTDQSFTSQYAGIFHFRLWQFGKWYDVVIDDRLPTMNRQLVYTKSISQNEFWTALLEKAYCKLLGGEYRVAEAGNLCEALEDFTGGVVEQFRVQNAPWNFPEILLKSVERHSLAGCFIENLPDGSTETQTDLGLIRGHSYSITGAKSLNRPGYGKVILLRVRNPWGRSEWKGPWSDGSPEWNSISGSTKQELGLEFKNDGEFWMSAQDFIAHFQWVDMCHLSPEVFSDAYGNMLGVASWTLSVVKGSWVRGVTAGGANYLHMNPQIKFILDAADDDNGDGLCNIVIALMQRTVGKRYEDYFQIGLKVYEVRDASYFEGTLDQNFLRYNMPVADVRMKQVREVSGRFNLPPGQYCAIAYTYQSGQEGEYMLRLYCERHTQMQEMDYRIGMAPPDVMESDIPPMKIGAQLEVTMDRDQIQAYFNKVCGSDKEVDWRELQQVLAIAIQDELKPKVQEKKGFWGSITSAYEYVHDKIFGKPPPEYNAFSSVRKEGFTNDVCRSMVALMDLDHSGKLGLNEFQLLWKEITRLKSIYEQYSQGSFGMLTTSSGLTDALEAAGFHLNRRVLTDVVHRYSTKDGRIAFDDFLHCALKIKIMSDFFTSKDKTKSNKAEIQLEEFMQKALYS